MTSVKTVANCLGINAGANLSVLYHLFGFSRRVVPGDPAATARVSILQKVRDVQGKHIHLNVIRVGFDAIAAVQLDWSYEKLDYAIYRIANIYRPVGLGIGRVEHYDITAAQSGGSDDLGSEDEADELSDDWSVINDATDVFVVRNISASFVGVSPRPGSCDKDSKDDGLIGGEIVNDIEQVARTFAHENGHFLNLKHNHGGGTDCPATTAGKNNLMAQSRCAVTIRDSVLLTGSQGATMLSRCSVKAGC